MKFLKILVVCLLLIPSSVFASEKTYNTKNLEQTLKEEAEIAKKAVDNNVEGATLFEYDLTGYQETEDQITIYMFRGSGCKYCKKFLTFLNSIVPEYGKYFKLESYEVWYDKNNSKLMKEVGDFLEEEAGGVPYIVIGDQVFPGYASQYDESIKTAIVNLYNSKDRYDVFEEMAKAEEAAKKANGANTTTIIIWTAALVTLGTAANMVYNYKNNQRLNERLDVIEKSLTEIKSNQNTSKKEEKTTSKKNTNKPTKK